MGIFRKTKEKVIKIITNFLSNRRNLTLFQCILYGVVGYIMGQYLDWIRLVFMLVVMYLIQFITRTKAVADGMMFRQLMIENEWNANDIIQKIKNEADKARKNNDIN